MGTQAEIFKQFTRLAADLPQPLQKEVAAVIHKIRYPMIAILEKVPGDSLTERSKKLKVSRQTMYVWMSEKFRPTRTQAKRISRVTGVPVEHITDDGFEVINDARRKAREKAARMAARSAEDAPGIGRTPSRRRRKIHTGDGDGETGAMHSPASE